jgi:hypothetical protein
MIITSDPFDHKSGRPDAAGQADFVVGIQTFVWQDRMITPRGYVIP